MSLRPAIHVDHLCKQYRLHDPAARHTTLRDAIASTVRRPFAGRRKRAARFWALDDINCDVMPGDTVGIIGQNGAGKSTLLKVLARITHPIRGMSELRGLVPASIGRMVTHAAGALRSECDGFTWRVGPLARNAIVGADHPMIRCFACR